MEIRPFALTPAQPIIDGYISETETEVARKRVCITQCRLRKGPRSQEVGTHVLKAGPGFPGKATGSATAQGLGIFAPNVGIDGEVHEIHVVLLQGHHKLEAHGN